MTVEGGSMTRGVNWDSPCDSGNWVNDTRGELGLTMSLWKVGK